MAMRSDILEKYIHKVYGYAINHTHSREEADELSQEILFTVVRELPKLREEDRFEPWLWGIAGNIMKSFRRQKGKQRAMCSYDMLQSVAGGDPYDHDELYDREETYDFLRTKIAMLSEIYRHIIILYYYDGLSTKQIAERLQVPEGTVTWRLSEARKKLKKECENMNEIALKPVKLDIRINGEGNYKDPVSPFPYVYICDALSQNILFYCYEKPKSIEDLAKLCGVPAYYIEDALDNLIKREAVSESPKGRYRTAFMIYSGKEKEYNEKIRSLWDPVVGGFLESMKRLGETVGELGIHTAGKSENELLYLYAVLALEYLSEKYNPVTCTPHPIRYDGFRWSYYAHLMQNGRNPVRSLGREESSNLGSRGTYRHVSYHFAGFCYRRMMFDNEINVCEDLLCGRGIGDMDAAASAIAKGFLKKQENGACFVAVPAFTKEQKKRFDRLAEQAFRPSIGAYAHAVRQVVEGYRKLFPEHLKEDVDRACHYMFLTLYAVNLCDIFKEKGWLIPPSGNSVCDVMIQFK